MVCSGSNAECGNQKQLRCLEAVQNVKKGTIINGKKERLQKELDLLLEKIRFWRYVIFAIIYGTVGMLFAASQGKLIIGVAVLGLVVAVKRLSSIDTMYRELLNELERVD